MRLAAGMEHRTYPTVDAAIRAAFPVAGGPLDARGIDYGHVGAGTTGLWQMAARLDREARVRAVVGQLPPWRQRVLIAYAHRYSYRTIARVSGVSDRSVRRWHREDREHVSARLQDLGLLEIGA